MTVQHHGVSETRRADPVGRMRASSVPDLLNAVEDHAGRRRQADYEHVNVPIDRETWLEFGLSHVPWVARTTK